MGDVLMSAPDTERLLAELDRRRDDLVALTADLVAFDTTVRGSAGERHRAEHDLQDHLADRLRAAGATVDVFTPTPADLPRSPQTPEGLGFDGRPQLIARFPGTGGGRSLLFNGHIDVVSAEPKSAWSSDPFRADVRDGRVYGRGTCDMKGGIAAMVIAAETLASLGIRLPGDLLLNTVTDEEWNGAGTLASLAYGVRADAAIVPEPTDLDVVTAQRGILGGTLTVDGRPGHAEYPPGDWRTGGAVNAIEKTLPALTALQTLRERWADDPAHTHPLLPPPSIVPTTIKGGEWWVTYPASCEVCLDVTYLPVQADGDGWASKVRAEIEAAVRDACAADGWLRAHPPRLSWDTELPPAEVDRTHPVVTALEHAAGSLGRTPRILGEPSWTDAATLTRLADTPAVCLGPTATRPDGSPTLHTIDEYIEVDDLLATAKALALAAVTLTAPAA
ncbi:ArgE/DapE family deacylase [Streptomyces longispororuber]|uniref:ArgE/DapE family deacylase n=1 Tax=Streptomyces longispororuber TaxID=68230 RepID=UPI0021097AA1|nr:ArgE/DapE family deacylase [Streptomyces longispororuber]MCQ4213395.1 ArgE/DapE family deacylase [Streptomyces longispororuber]